MEHLKSQSSLLNILENNSSSLFNPILEEQVLWRTLQIELQKETYKKEEKNPGFALFLKQFYTVSKFRNFGNVSATLPKCRGTYPTFFGLFMLNVKQTFPPSSFINL